MTFIKRALNAVFLALTLFSLTMGIVLLAPRIINYFAKNEIKIDLKEYSKYTLPMQDSMGRYCSSVSVNYGGLELTLSNAHCCEVEGINPLQDNYRFIGPNYEKILYISTNHDVCILTSKLKSPIKVADKEFEYLDSVLVMGYPRGEELTPRYGHVLLLEQPAAVNYDFGVKTQPSNWVSVLIFGGNSGSPVFNEQGEVVNLIYAGPAPVMQYGISVPLSFIKEALDDYVSIKDGR